MRVVGPEHPITLGNLPARVRELVLDKPAHYTVLAEDGKKLLGFLRYEFSNKGVLCAAGTWVTPEARSCGLARELWLYLLRRARPRAVWVKTVSPGGRALVVSLVREFTRVKWTVVG